MTTVLVWGRGHKKEARDGTERTQEVGTLEQYRQGWKAENRGAEGLLVRLECSEKGKCHTAGLRGAFQGQTFLHLPLVCRKTIASSGSPESQIIKFIQEVRKCTNENSQENQNNNSLAINKVKDI